MESMKYDPLFYVPNTDGFFQEFRDVDKSMNLEMKTLKINLISPLIFGIAYDAVSVIIFHFHPFPH